jgi:hypothetical protein
MGYQIRREAHGTQKERVIREREKESEREKGRASERERERKRKKERARERDRERDLYECCLMRDHKHEMW